MKQFALLIFFTSLLSTSEACAQEWEIVKGNLLTRWANDVTPENVWPQYPRPQLQREEWLNLNGLWRYAITNMNQKQPSRFDGNILVPFPVQSALSGVKKKVKANQTLWYKRNFNIPNSWKSKNLILHFEASDWHTKVWINGKLIGEHKGGYNPFSFSIAKYVNSKNNELVVAVNDPTNKGFQPLGKQVLTPGGIFYTPITGIWQTVWLEPVNYNHIEHVNFRTDIDKSLVDIDVKTKLKREEEVIGTIRFENKIVKQIHFKSNQTISVKLNNIKLWEPDSPNLYTVELKLQHKNEITDKITSYFGMRKISLGLDQNGFKSMLLNNKALFQNGPLDQGYWPDGLYTPPTEEAMVYDLKVIQQLGFNMLRKHVKVESRRFYYWCDKMGLLVWQDMPNGDQKIGPRDPDIQRTKESEKQFMYELKQMIIKHNNHPSIIMWVPFNEGWGQFKTAEVVKRVKEIDPTRLVNNASGWTDRGVGDIYDIHNYPSPTSPDPEANRAIALGEFGGLGLKIKGHMWEEKNWGYSNLKSKEELVNRYESFYEKVWNFNETKGLSAAVYTQITDVETEANGLMTYDREVLKISPELAMPINSGKFVTSPKFEPNGGLINLGNKITINAANNATIYYTLDGTEPSTNSIKYTHPFVFENSGTIRAIAIQEGKKSRIVNRTFIKTTIKKPTYHIQFSKRYDAGGSFALIDGATGSKRFSDGKWQGFQESDLDVTFDLKSKRELDEISIRFIQDQSSWVFFPECVTISISTDGKSFNTIIQEDIKIIPSKTKGDIRTITIRTNNTNIRFIRVHAKNIGKCPEWHEAKGGKSWIFTDEIILK